MTRKSGNKSLTPLLSTKKVFFSPGRRAWAFNHVKSAEDPTGTGTSYRMLYGNDKVVQSKGASTDIFKLGNDKTVILTEGLSDCTSVYLNTGLPTWTLTCGAKSRIPDHRHKDFHGLDKIFVLYDRDPAGYSGAREIVKSLKHITTAQIFIVELPTDFKPEKKADISEWFAAGHTKAEFQKLLDTAIFQTNKKKPLMRYQQESTALPLKLLEAEPYAEELKYFNEAFGP